MNEQSHSPNTASKTDIASVLTVAMALADTGTRSEAVNNALRAAVVAFGAEYGTLALLAGSGGDLEIAGVKSVQPELVARLGTISRDSSSPLAVSARTGQPMWMESEADVAALRPQRHVAPRRPTGSACCVLLLAGECAIGSLCLGFAHPRVFDETERQVFVMLGHLCAQAIERGRARDTEQDDRRLAEASQAEVLARAQAAHAAAAQADRLKDEFLARVSHELRTPLASMMMWLHVLRTGDAGNRALALGAVDQSARAQAQVIDDLLDVARGLSGKLRINQDLFEPAPTIESAVQGLSPLADAKSIRLVTALASDVGYVLGDEGRLRQIVGNLVDNAIKFTPEGGRIAVEFDREGENLRIAVRDNGAGMSAEFLPHAFAAFSQVDVGTARTHDGLGLGLAIVRQLVELHGGTVCAESAGEGKGAVFTVTLPAQTRNAPPELQTPLWKAARRLRGLRILLVEDDDLARDALALVLEGYGVRVTTAASASEALDALRREWPDVLLSDIGMPDEDGYALIHQVRALEAERGTPLPAAALTVHTRPEDRARCVDAGFQVHVAKPVQPADLIAVVLGLVGRAA